MSDIPPEEKVIRAMERAADLYGISQSHARMYGTLFFEGEMTLDEVSDELDVSKSTASRAMSYLEDLHLVHSRKKEDHGKTKFYRAEEDLEEAFMELVRNQASKEIEIMTEALDEAEEKFRQKGDEENLEKVRKLQSFYSRASKFIALVKKMPSGKAFDRVYSALKKVSPRKD